MSDSRPFRIASTWNEQMRAYDVMVQVGGIQTKDELEAFTKDIAEFMAGDSGFVKRVGFDS